MLLRQKPFVPSEPIKTLEAVFLFEPGPSHKQKYHKDPCTEKPLTYLKYVAKNCIGSIVCLQVPRG